MCGAENTPARPYAHGCVPNPCVIMDCRQCTDCCAAGKLDRNLEPDNPLSYELYWICLADRLDDPAEVLRLVEPAARCGGGAPTGICPRSGQVVCLAPLERYPNQTRITSDCWARLCALSRIPLVENLVGGYWLP